MKDGAVVVSTGRKRGEIAAGLRRMVVVELDRDGALMEVSVMDLTLV